MKISDVQQLKSLIDRAFCSILGLDLGGIHQQSPIKEVYECLRDIETKIIDSNIKITPIKKQYKPIIAEELRLATYENTQKIVIKSKNGHKFDFNESEITVDVPITTHSAAKNTIERALDFHKKVHPELYKHDDTQE